jgi:hypothetical protein
MIPRGTTFEFEYLGEFKIKIKNILGNELGAHMRLIHEKNQRPKISCYCTFNVNNIPGILTRNLWILLS